MLDSEKDRAYLLKNHGINFPAYAKYIRQPTRIYFVGDFEDGEEITFYHMCEKPCANAAGNAWYYSKSKGSNLINISDIQEWRGPGEGEKE